MSIHLVPAVVVYLQHVYRGEDGEMCANQIALRPHFHCPVEEVENPYGPDFVPWFAVVDPVAMFPGLKFHKGDVVGLSLRQLRLFPRLVNVRQNSRGTHVVPR